MWRLNLEGPNHRNDIQPQGVGEEGKTNLFGIYIITIFDNLINDSYPKDFLMFCK